MNNIKYILGLTEQQAKDKSCDYFTPPEITSPNDITKYMFGWIKHKDRVEYALVIPEKYILKLTTEDQALLIDQSILEAEGWFPDPI